MDKHAIEKNKDVRFDHTKKEPYWQKKWEELGVYTSDMVGATKPFYNLMMFPYPSAEGLHVGNMYAFTGVDIYGRFKRMQGYDVFEPIGLDGFGIHSENYALKVNRNPKEQAKISEANFYRQLRSIGNGFDWKRTVETYNPNYYKWTQWLFIQLFKAGLAYKASAPVNWCPSCLTVLADEQVIAKDGKNVCERCGTEVTTKNLSQWFFRIASGVRPDGTPYPDTLLNNLNHIDWVEKVKTGQRNWIGRKEGINIGYPVEGINQEIICFTTRPDTNFGATFIVVGPEHTFVSEILDGVIEADEATRDEIRAYVQASTSKSQEERIAEAMPAGRQGGKKTGVFTGYYALNRLNGKKLPVWISDFVLGNVGTGAVIGVPGHDKRDFQFATTFDIPVVRVVVANDGDKSQIEREEQVQEEEGTMINSEFLNGLDIHEATKKIMQYLEEKKWGKRVVHYHLRDWLISRQRYWGAPIPMVHCQHCEAKGITYFSLKNGSSKSKIKDQKSKIQSKEQKDQSNNIAIEQFNNPSDMPGWFPVPEEQLPVELPDVKDWKPKGTGKAPLASVPSFVETVCPNCGGKADRETDVCDTFLDSSWYQLRYPFVGFDDIPFGSEKYTSTEHGKEAVTIAKKWLPVNSYIGGAEHTVLHLLYARFVTMALKDMGYIDFEEPFTQFRAHGLIIKEGAKMSKSKGNIVVPDTYIEKFGADILRAYLMFLGPFESGGDFRDSGIAGMYRFGNRVWRLVTSKADADPSAHPSRTIEKTAQLDRLMHKTIKKVTDDMEVLHYNTSMSAIMEYINSLNESLDSVSKEHIQVLVKLLAPFMPHMMEELYQKLRISELRIANGDEIKTEFESVHKQPWPLYDPSLLVEEEVTMVVQINGKTRETLKMPNADAQVQSKVEETAKQSDRLKKYIEGKAILKAIFVPGRLINFVIKP